MPAGAGNADEQLRQVAMRDRLEAADVQHLSIARLVRAGAQECIRGVVHAEIAELRSVSVDLDLAILDRQADEPGDKTLSVVLQQLPRTVDVGQPEGARAHAEHVVVEQMVMLAGRLLMPFTSAGWTRCVRHRQALGLAVDLPGGQDDLDPRVVVAHARIDNCARQLISRSLRIACCRCG